MLTQRLRLRIVAVTTLLVAPTVSSSFVPRTSLVRPTNDYAQSYLLSVKGGSDEGNDVEQRQNMPPPTDPSTEPPPAEPVVPETPPVVTPPPVQPVPAVAAEITPPAPVAETPPAPSLLGPNAPPPGFLRKNLPSFPWHKLPNYLTYIRCLAIPALIFLFDRTNSHVAAGVLFAVASITDWFDGYLARRWDIASPFGAFLDPVADKLMVSTSLILLAGRYGAKVSIPTAIILAREISVSALREWMAQRGQRDVVKVGMQGKVKTALTMVALTVLLLVPYPAPEAATFLSKLLQPGLAMLYLCSLVTITSGSVYFLAAAPLLLAKDETSAV